MIIDSHCHLLHSKSQKLIPDIISDAKINDVQILLNISTHPDEFDKIINVSDRYENIYSSIGIHPHSASLINRTNYNLINVIIVAIIRLVTKFIQKNCLQRITLI